MPKQSPTVQLERLPKNENNEVSLYSGELTTPVLVQQMNKLRAAFPEMGADFFDILTERLVKNKFSDERLKDAVNHVIDNFHYKKLNVADIIEFDKVQKLFTYNEVLALVAPSATAKLDKTYTFEDFRTRKIGNKTYWYMYEKE